MVSSSSCRQPFHACANLCVLVAAACDFTCCSECKPDSSYFATEHGIKRKRRRPKSHELSPREPRTVCWQISQRTARTAKHKHANKFQSSLSSISNNVSKRASKKWQADSGATVSVTGDLSQLETITDVNPNRKVQVANGQFVDVVCIGTVRLNTVDSDGKPYTMLLENVLYSPHFSGNLLSVEEMYKQHKMATVFKGNKAAFVTSTGVSIPFSTDSRKRYMLQVNSVQPHADPRLWHRRLMHAGTAACRRMGRFIRCLSQPGLDFSKCPACVQGGMRKLPIYPSSPRRKQFAEKKLNRFTYFGERIAADLCGPFPNGYNGEKYMLIFHDSYSKYIATYAIKDKTRESVLAGFNLFLSDHADQLTRGVGTFWTDNGGELLNSDMEAFCEELAIKRTYTVPYMPSQNPYAERANGTILRPLRTILAESKCEERFWSILIDHVAHVHNVLCDDDGMSPYQLLHGEQFDYNKLRAPTCLCYYLVPERDRASKLSPRARQAIYLGPDPHRNGHRVYVPSMQRYTTAFHVVFDEHRFYDPAADRARVSFDDRPDIEFDPVGSRIRRQRENTQAYREERDADIEHAPPSTDELPEPAPSPSPADDFRHGDRDFWNEDHCENSRCLYPRGHDGPCSDQEVHDRPRDRHQTRRFAYACCTQHDDCVFHADHCGRCEDSSGKPLKCSALAHAVQDSDSVLDLNPMETLRVIIDDVQHEVLRVDLADQGDVPCPKQYEDTQSSPLKSRWDESMREEHEALLRNGTWEYVSRNDRRLRGRTPTKSRWVYTIKYNRDGTIARFKSRFVVCGYSQRQGLDYDRAFSATLRATSFRTLLAIAAGKKMRLMQFDVSNAFTQAYMDDVDMFVEPAKGHEVWETIGGKRVSKLLYLRRALYGTKQASRLWQNALREFLTHPAQGFVCSTTDPCLYHRSIGDEEIILGIYVDDILVAYRGDNLYSKFCTAFFERFPGKKDKLTWFLGMAIDQHEDYSIHVDHALSIEKMGAKYAPNNSVTRECPSPDLFNKLDRAQNDTERAKVEPFQYASLVGAILYIAVMSRPDIAWHASILAKFLSDPSEDCCAAATQLLQYLVCTRKRRLYFSGRIDVPDGLEKHAADIKRNYGFVGYTDSSWGNKYPYPMFGYGIYLYGGLISYASKQLKTVAFSSCEAEYAAGSYACKEIEFVRNICWDMGLELHGRLVLAVDNTACIDIAHDVGVSGRTKHFDRAIHYLRDLTQLKRVLPAYVNTHQQRADGYTKALDKSTFTKWCSHIIHD